MKTCNVCEEIKPISEFYKRSPAAGGGHEAFCKLCKKEKYKRDRAWEHLKERYGVDKDKYYRILESQNGCCGICEEEAGDSKLHVDHCHTTGAVRGLLCHKCNTGIGLLGDSLESVLKAVNYLKDK